MKNTLIKGGYVLTMDPAIGDFPIGDVHLQDNRIVAVGENLDVPMAEVIDAAGYIVTPGFIDGHSHVWQNLLREKASDWSFPKYMVEARAMYCGCFDADDAYLANYTGGLEHINAGTTTVVDHSHLQKSPEVSDALAQGLLDSGIGGFFCYALQNVPDFLDGSAIDGNKLSDLLTRPADQWHYENADRVRLKFFSDNNALLRFGIALAETTPYVPQNLAAEWFERGRDLDPQLITSHWNATHKNNSYQSNLEHLVTAKSFFAPTVLAHNNQLSEDDLKLMVKERIGSCTCPDTECGMGLGTLIARRFAQLGGATALGTDTACYVRPGLLRQAHLILEVERMNLAIEKGALPVETGWTSRAALELITIDGARAIGLGDEIGSLSPGKRADLLMIKPQSLVNEAVTDPVSALLFYTSVADIKLVMVNGAIRKKNGNLVDIDYASLKANAATSVKRIQARYEQLPREQFQKAWAGMF